MIGRVLGAIFCLFLLFGVFNSSINDGITNWRSEEITSAHVAVTAVETTTANVTLAQDLYQANITKVVSISSTLVESPIPFSYVESTKSLTVSSLLPSETRTLTITYRAETDDTVMRVLGPFIAFIIFGGLTAIVLYAVYKGRHR